MVRARPFIQPLFVLGAALSGLTGCRQFLAGFEGRATGTRIVIGLAIGLVRITAYNVCYTKLVRLLCRLGLLQYG